MYLIFDFDGTLVDSFGKAVEKFNVLADEFNFKRVHPTEIPELRNLTSKEFIQYLKIPLYKIPQILYSARKQMNNEMSALKSFANLPQILQKIHDANFSLGILTSNSKENVIAWLEANKIKNLFDFIHIESNFFGKTRILKKILKRYKINKLQAFYIGDETRDIDAAKQSGIHSVAVTWGFNSEKVLLQHQPDYVVKTPDDLLEICKKFKLI